MTPSILDAGGGQTIVVYVSTDTGGEVDPAGVYARIAAESSERAAAGERIVSIAAVPMRHAAVLLGREGSGFETKFAVAVVYARS
jgi:hypothetical protein